MTATKNLPLFAIEINDVQTVAKEKYGRRLTGKELYQVEKMINNAIDWYDYCEIAIDEVMSNY